MGHLGVVLYEYLGEEYPEVLGSILGALKAIVNVIGMTKMTPPIKDLLPRLTPILKNRHEKVNFTYVYISGCLQFHIALLDKIKSFLNVTKFNLVLNLHIMKFFWYLSNSVCYWSCCRYKKIVLILWAESQIEVRSTFPRENGWGYASNCWNYWKLIKKLLEERQ